MTDGMEVMNPLPTTRFATLVPTLLSIAQQCTVAEHGLTTARTRGTSSPATETTTSQTQSLCDTGYVVTQNRCVASYSVQYNTVVVQYGNTTVRMARAPVRGILLLLHTLYGN